MRYTQNRELSWLSFNKRVLEIGSDESTPLFERLKFVAIFQSNLSEFFMIRVGGLHDMAQVKSDFRDNKSFMTAQEQLDAIYRECVGLEHQRDEIFASIESELRDYGIYRRVWDDLEPEQLEYVEDYAERSVIPMLSAQIIDQSHPFPHLQNGKLYVAMELHRKPNGTEKKGSKKKPDNTPLVGIIPMPPMVPRIIRLPGDDLQYMLLEDALCSLAPQIFEMYETGEPAVICVTRNADIDPDDEDYADDDYRLHMKKILKKRTRLAPVRLQVQGHMRNMRELITKHLNLSSDQVFHLESPIDLSYVYKLEGELSQSQKKNLLYKPFSPVWPASISRKKPMFDQIKDHDILLSYPYDSMDPFVTLLREAANDPAVASIKITLYRLAKISKIAECLVSAAENGKDVVILMELRARFDEEANIGWAEYFEEAGCTVIYGMEGYKCHSKICQITRLGDDGLELYTQLATGNYNEKTAKQYTDLALMTFDRQIGIDGVDFFNNLSMGNLDGKYTKLWVSPTSFKSNVIARIDDQIEVAKSGGRGRVIIKCNSVTDVDLIDKLAEASQAGVKIDLIIRGICCLLPGIKGETENISVISIVGRLLEHSRIYCFGEGGETTVYLASADMMTRNTERRVEIGFPVEEPDVKQRVMDFLDAQLSDTANASKLQSDGSYVKLSTVTKGKLFDSQQFFIDDALERASSPKKKKEKKQAALRAEIVNQQMEEVRAAVAESEGGSASKDSKDGGSGPEESPSEKDPDSEICAAGAGTIASAATSIEGYDGVPGEAGDAGTAGIEPTGGDVDEAAEDAAAATGGDAEATAAETAGGDAAGNADETETASEDETDGEEATDVDQLFEGSALADSDKHELTEEQKARWKEQLEADEEDRQKDWDAAAAIGYASSKEIVEETPGEEAASEDEASAEAESTDDAPDAEADAEAEAAAVELDEDANKVEVVEAADAEAAGDADEAVAEAETPEAESTSEKTPSASDEAAGAKHAREEAHDAKAIAAEAGTGAVAADSLETPAAPESETAGSQHVPIAAKAEIATSSEAPATTETGAEPIADGQGVPAAAGTGTACNPEVPTTVVGSNAEPHTVTPTPAQAIEDVTASEIPETSPRSVTTSDDTDAPHATHTTALLKVDAPEVSDGATIADTAKAGSTAAKKEKQSAGPSAEPGKDKGKGGLFSRIGAFFSRIFRHRKKPAGYLEAGDSNKDKSDR